MNPVEEEPQQVKQQVLKVTKEKKPGRVAAVKRLAEYNRKRKEKMKVDYLPYIGLTAFAVVVGGLFIYQRYKTPEVKPKVNEAVDPFLFE